MHDPIALREQLFQLVAQGDERAFDAWCRANHRAIQESFPAWLKPEPIPREVMSGIMPATNAKVVIRIGRRRSRFARRIASSRGTPSRRSALVWSTCKIAFFLTTPKSTRMPSAE